MLQKKFEKSSKEIWKVRELIRIIVLQFTSNKDNIIMKLSTEAIEKANNNRTRLKLALTLDCTERWISQLFKENRMDGDLTKASALQVIREETGLTDDQILETATAER